MHRCWWYLKGIYIILVHCQSPFAFSAVPPFVVYSFFIVSFLVQSLFLFKCQYNTLPSTLWRPRLCRFQPYSFSFFLLTCKIILTKLMRIINAALYINNAGNPYCTQITYLHSLFCNLYVYIHLVCKGWDFICILIVLTCEIVQI